MNSNNMILYLPFDEPAGSLIAYDYSKNRADGQIIGATFKTGKNGNAIKFSGGATCEISPNVISDLSQDFSILLWVKSEETECGTPAKLIWVLNFSGINNYLEFPIEIKPKNWYSLAMVKRGIAYNFYLNSQFLGVLSSADTLLGVSLNQDFYGTIYGLGSLDDVKIYDAALSQNEIITEFSSNNFIRYTIDGIDMKDYGVFVSDSEGVVDRPKLKAMASDSWDNYHGESVDLNHKFYEPRGITLSCFIKADSKGEFIAKLANFEQIFDKQGTNRLVIEAVKHKPLIYEVYCKDDIAVSKKWNADLMVGTFKLTLTEPEPVKRILKHYRNGVSTKTCTITLTSTKLVNIYWGDGIVDYDVYGTNKIITHDYIQDGEYYPVITGCIDEITSFSTNAIIVWSKL